MFFLKKIYIVHAGLAHVSPYMTALSYNLKNHGYKVYYISDIFQYFFSKGEESYIYFHRLGRLYSNNDLLSVQKFLKRVVYLKHIGFKFLWTIHNFFPLDRLPNNVDNYVIANLAQQVDCIFTHTETMKKEAEKLFNKNVVNHGFGVDFVINNNIMMPKIKETSGFTFALFGNVRKYKNMALLLESFLKLQSKINNINLLIIGPDYNNYFSNLLVTYDLKRNKSINFINEFIPDFRVYIQNVDAFVCSYETNIPQFKHGFFPSSIANLGKYSVPIICPDCDSVIDVIGEKNNAFLYNDTDYNSLENVMNKVCSANAEEKKCMVKSLKNHLSQQLWGNVTDIIREEIER